MSLKYQNNIKPKALYQAEINQLKNTLNQQLS